TIGIIGSGAFFLLGPRYNAQQRAQTEALRTDITRLQQTQTQLQQQLEASREEDLDAYLLSNRTLLGRRAATFDDTRGASRGAARPGRGPGGRRAAGGPGWWRGGGGMWGGWGGGGPPAEPREKGSAGASPSRVCSRTAAMSHNRAELPLLLITLGDVAGIGPEIVARAWPELLPLCRPVVVGDASWLRRALDLAGSTARVRLVNRPADAEAGADVVPCLQGTSTDLDKLRPGQVSAAGGQAAYDFLCTAIDRVLAGDAGGIVTAPLHKEGLHAAGLRYPGHTEILAERCGVRQFAMLLYGDGLGVAHVTLHMALRDVFRHLSVEAVLDKTRLLEMMLTRILDRRPRVGVAALNPHASDGGLFGDEEETTIRPAVLA